MIEDVSQPTVTTGPFLRWAGGKTWLVRRLADALHNQHFRRYHEPFLGGGSVFFATRAGTSARLSDTNADLIQTYVAVRDDVEGVIDRLGQYQNTEEDYYIARDDTPVTTAARAARFIFLNQTSFNGIYRVNLRGQYNVPFGHRSKPFLEPAVLRTASFRLRSASLSICDFADTRHHIDAGDLVFIDPPYTVSHNKNGFIKYNERLFNVDDFHRLREYIEYVKEVGASYILTNAAHDFVRDLFNFGDFVHLLSRANLIGGAKAMRGHTEELLFTNLRLSL